MRRKQGSNSDVLLPLHMRSGSNAFRTEPRLEAQESGYVNIVVVVRELQGEDLSELLCYKLWKLRLKWLSTSDLLLRALQRDMR